MGTRIAWAGGLAVVAALSFWLLLRTPRTETTSTAVVQVNDDAPAADLQGHQILKPATSVHEAPAPRGATAKREPHHVKLIDDAIPGVRVSGRVLLAGSDEPVEGATVAAWTVERRERTCEIATTDEGGGFTLARVAARQPVWIVAKAPGWHAAASSVTLSADEDDHVIHVGAGGTLEGHVTRPDGQPAVDMEVWLVRPGLPLPDMGRGPYFDELRYFYVSGALTDASGAYAFRGVPLNAEFLPAVRLSAFAEATGDTVRFTHDGDILQRDIPIPEPASLTVIVFDGAGQVLADASISLETKRIQFSMSTPDQPGKRPADGSFRVEGMAPGLWSVRAHIPGAGFPEQEVRLAPGADEAVEFRPATGAALDGLVVDSDGRPVESAGVSFWASDHRSARTDQEGRFRFTGLSAGSGTLRVRAVDHGPTIEQVLEDRVPAPRPRPLSPVRIDDVRPGGDPLRIVLPYLGRIHGSLVGLEPGTTLRRLLLTPTGSGTGGPSVSKDGTFTMDAPAVGAPFLFKLTAPDGRYWMREVEALRPAEDRDLGVIVFEEGVDLKGHVVAARGGPVENARVRLTQRWAAQKAWTDSDGAFHLTQIPRRPVYVRVDARGYPPAFRVLDARKPVNQRITLSGGGILEIHVLDADGVPVSRGSMSAIWVIDARYASDRDGLTEPSDLYALDASGVTRLWRDAATYSVNIESASHDQHATLEAVIREGETTSINVRLERRP